MHMLCIWYWYTCGIVCMLYMLCCRHVVLCMCMVWLWYPDICIRCVVLCRCKCIGLYCTLGVGVCIVQCCMPSVDVRVEHFF